jgi:Reverse transcriptase (RNA-dependent DNA polymerase)
LDAVNAFVHAHIDQLVHVSFPPGFKDQRNVLQLLRALYGLRSSPLLWLKDLTATMRQLGFVEVPDDPCLFIHSSNPIMAFFYVDDIVLISPENLRHDLYDIRDQLMKAYEIREIGPLHHFLGATIIRDRKDHKLWLSQADYIDKTIKKFHLEHATITHVPLPTETIPKWDQQASKNQITAYQQRVGSALWAAIFSRPDIARACSLLSVHNTNPSPQARRGIDQVLAYLNSTKNLAIELRGEQVTDQPTGSTDISKSLVTQHMQMTFLLAGVLKEC